MLVDGAAPAGAEDNLIATEELVCKPFKGEECALEAAAEVLPTAGGPGDEKAARVPLSPVGSNFLLATESPPPLFIEARRTLADLTLAPPPPVSPFSKRSRSASRGGEGQ